MSVDPRTPSSLSNFGYDAERRMGRVVLEPQARCSWAPCRWSGSILSSSISRCPTSQEGGGCDGT